MDRNYDTYAKVLRVNVALRKESVDRNILADKQHQIVMESLSARRAWIEIAQSRRISGRALVALRKESVDRNQSSTKVPSGLNCRSPQGERG